MPSSRATLLLLTTLTAAACAGDDGEGDFVSGVTSTSGDNPSITGDLPTGPPGMMNTNTAGVVATTAGALLDSGLSTGTGASPTTGQSGFPTTGTSGNPMDAGNAGTTTGGTTAGTTDTDDGPLNMAPVTFQPNVRIHTDSRGEQNEVVMATHPNGTIFVGWMDSISNPRPCGYAVSTDRGETWGNFHSMTTEAGSRAFAGDPAVAIDDAGNLYAVCQDYASGGLGTNYVLLSHSKDQGATWSPTERVNESLDKPWVGATGDGVVLLSWLGGGFGSPDAGIKRSTDYGATWSSPVSLGYINHGTTISFGGEGLVHVAYNTNEDTVTYSRSKDDGVTFEPARDLASQGTPCRSPCSPRSHPIIGADTDPTGQVVAITWASTLRHPDAEGDDDVWVIVSHDAGDTFSDPIRVNDNTNASRQFQSWAAVDKYGAVHVVWTDLRDGGQNATYYARMTDLEQGFEANVQVTDDTGSPASFLGDYKGIDILGRDVVVTWTDTRNDSGDIYFAKAIDAAAAGGPLM